MSKLKFLWLTVLLAVPSIVWGDIPDPTARDEKIPWVLYGKRRLRLSRLMPSLGSENDRE